MNHSFSFFLLLVFFSSALRSGLKKPSLFSSQELCKDLHWEIDTVDDERYDIEVKLAKNEKEALVFVMEMNTSLTLCQIFLWNLTALVLYLR